ncbi:MAG: transcriptional regulator [Alphaproteobacteria bacterium]|nr:MAG: transcriptional regulator [Alphaproteobacteria bacterium]
MHDTDNAIGLAAELTAAWLANPHTRTSAEDVPAFLVSMHAAVSGLGRSNDKDQPIEAPRHEPAVSVRKSLASPDHIVSMIDGKPYKTLRRHLATNGLTPEQYRERYNLKADYPMVAESYSESRRAMAHKIGLGRKPGQKVNETAPATERKSSKPRKGAAPEAAGE